MKQNEKDRKNMEKENNSNESENEIPDFKFFEAFWIWTKNK